MLKKIFRGLATLLGAFFGYLVFLLMKYAINYSNNGFDKAYGQGDQTILAIIFIIFFAFLFFKIAPTLGRQSNKVAVNIENDLRGVSGNKIFVGAIGLIMGLVIAFLLTQMFNFVTNKILYAIIVIVSYCIFGFLGVVIAGSKGTEILSNAFTAKKSTGEIQAKGDKKKRGNEIPKIFDTSVIIDGRIADIMSTGFLEGPIVIPEFVLVELRHIADSADSLKRVRGRRGLDVLKNIQSEYGVEIFNTDGEKSLKAIPEVDVKLLKLAQIMNGKVVTNDYNLNKVAAINGVSVLNINKLANCLKPVVLPGEEMRVELVKQGKDPQQGIGYLDDGTMIVVEDGRNMVGKTVNLRVTSVLQTSAGRMIFGRVEGVKQ